MTESNGYAKETLCKAGTVAVIPAYNEERFIGSVVIKACKYADTVIVVDDGSSDATAEIARLAGATVIQHEQNSGKGAALSTGLRAARQYDPAVVVVLDADYQHRAREMGLVTAPVLAGEADIAAEMPHFWVEKVQDALNEAGKPLKGSNVLVLKDASQCWA